MGIGKQIRIYREQIGWTLDKLSEASGVERGTISALELRDSSRSKYFPDIAKALRLSLEELADETYTIDITSRAEIGPGFAPANEPTTLYNWPFQNLKPHQWSLLTAIERKHVEDGALMFIKARDDPKHAAPEKNAASA